MPYQINPVNRSEIRKALLFGLLILIVSILILVFFQDTNPRHVPPIVISSLFIGFPLIWLGILLFGNQVTIFEDRIEVETWFSIYLHLHLVKTYPSQQVSVNQVPSIGIYGFPYKLLSLNKVNGKRDSIFLSSGTGLSDPQNANNTVDKSIVTFIDVSDKDKLISKLLALPAYIIFLLAGLFILYIMVAWLIGFLAMK